MAYMKVMVNPHDELSWHRILQLLDGVGPKLSQTIIDYQRAQQFNFAGMDYAPFKKKAAYNDLQIIAKLMATPQQSPTDTLQRVLAVYEPVLKKTYDDHNKREQDLNSLIALSERFRSLASMLDEFSLFQASSRWLMRYQMMMNMWCYQPFIQLRAWNGRGCLCCRWWMAISIVSFIAGPRPN